jgi:hypothetical protein
MDQNDSLFVSKISDDWAAFQPPEINQWLNANLPS